MPFPGLAFCVSGKTDQLLRFIPSVPTESAQGKKHAIPGIWPTTGRRRQGQRQVEPLPFENFSILLGTPNSMALLMETSAPSEGECVCAHFPFF